MTAPAVDRLAASRFVSLTTYRRDGTAVATPVWVTRDGPHLVVWTGRNTGKAKRLRHTSEVTVAPCSARGTPRGEPVPGTARILPDGELDRVKRLLAAKYRIGWPALTLFNRLVRLITRRRTSEEVGIEITLS